MFQLQRKFQHIINQQNRIEKKIINLLIEITDVHINKVIHTITK